MPLNVLNEKKLYLIKKPRFKSLCLISLTQYRHSKLDLIYVRNIEKAYWFKIQHKTQKFQSRHIKMLKPYWQFNCANYLNHLRQKYPKHKMTTKSFER